MSPRGHLLGFLLLCSTCCTAQVFAKKRLVFDLGGGAGGLVFTQSAGPNDLLRVASVVGCGVQYGFGKRIGLAFRYERMSARRGILQAGPSRVASYTADLRVVVARWERGELDAAIGLGPAFTTLAADQGRLPREGRGTAFMLGMRWSRMVTPTVGYSFGATAHSALPEQIADERGDVVLRDGTPLKVGYRSIGLNAALLVRF